MIQILRPIKDISRNQPFEHDDLNSSFAHFKVISSDAVINLGDSRPHMRPLLLFIFDVLVARETVIGWTKTAQGALD